MTLNQIAIGLGAGAASALLYFAVISGSALAFALFYLAPLPVLLAGLGWGWTTALVAAIVGMILSGLATGPLLGVGFLIACAGPAACLTRFALLGRPVDPDRSDSFIEWYPAGRLMVWTVGLATAVVFVGAALMGAGSPALQESVFLALGQLAEDEAGAAIGLTDGVDITALSEMLARLLPAIAAAIWTLVMLLNLWLAGRIAISSGLLTRPMPDLAGAEVPPLTAATLAASVLLSFAPGLAGVAGSIALSALMVVYFLLGLIVVHVVTRGMAGRAFVLAGLYLTTLVLAWVIPLIAALGLADQFLRLRRRAAVGGAT